MRICFRVLGLVMAAVCTLGALALKPPPEKRSDPTSAPPKPSAVPRQKSLSPRQVLRTADYRLLVCAVAAASPTVLLFSPVILPLAQQRGLQHAALTVVIGSLTSAAGRLLLPWISDRVGRRCAALFAFAALAVLSVVFAFVQGWWVAVLYASLTFCYSGQAALLPAFAADRFGTANAGVNYGLLALGMSAGSLIFPPLARLLQGESAPHWIAAAAAAAGFVCLCFYGRAARRN
jgi:OFA family oxalate/formate antiporter-like MFS transporter